MLQITPQARTRITSSLLEFQLLSLLTGTYIF